MPAGLVLPGVYGGILEWTKLQHHSLRRGLDLMTTAFRGITKKKFHVACFTCFCSYILSFPPGRFSQQKLDGRRSGCQPSPPTLRLYPLYIGTILLRDDRSTGRRVSCFYPPRLPVSIPTYLRTYIVQLCAALRVVCLFCLRVRSVQVHTYTIPPRLSGPVDK